MGKIRVRNFVLILAVLLLIATAVTLALPEIGSFSEKVYAAETQENDQTHPGWSHEDAIDLGAYIDDLKSKDVNYNYYGLPSGKYYLSSSYKLDRELMVFYANVEICLNGYVLSGSGDNRLIDVNNATLKIYDCNPDRTNKYIVNEDGVYEWVGEPEEGQKYYNYSRGTLNYGKLTGTESWEDPAAGSGAGIIVRGESALEMYGGKFMGCVASEYGGAIVVFDEESKCTLNGVFIQGCKAGISGGGVYNNHGILTLEDTDITLSEAVNKGGAIYNGGTVNMTGGALGTNTAAEGAGIYCTGDGVAKL